MMFGRVDLGGAKQRLLAERVPALFFGTAVVAHVLAWAALTAVADDLPWFVVGPGPVLASVHILTIGVLIFSAVGASLQMLPVILGQPAPAERICLGIFYSLIIGACLLIGGFVLGSVTAMAVAVTVLAASLTLYGLEIGRLLRHGKGALLIKCYIWTALLSLAVALVLALALVSNYALGYLPDHGRFAVAHAMLGAFGFMGMMALGFSQILIPMFVIAEPSSERPLAFAFWLIASALFLGLLGVLSGFGVVTAAAAGVGLVGVAQHVRVMMGIIAGRMRKRLGPEFLLIRASWALLPASLMIAAALSLDLLPSNYGPLLIATALYGWLLSLLTGVLQRVMPFLASMQIARLQARPLAPTKLVSETPLTIHRYGHFGGLVGLAAGTVLAMPEIIATAGVAGTIGAIGFAWFAATVLQRTRKHLKAQPVGRTGRP
jgi:hypothetical protein